MLNLKLKNGSVCNVTNKEQEAVAVSWLTTKADLKDGVIGVSKWLQDRCDIKLGNEIQVSKIADEVPDQSESILLRPLDVFNFDVRLMWEQVAAVTISGNFRYIAPTQKVTIVIDRQRKDFEVTGSPNAVYKATSISRVRISHEDEVAAGPALTFESIGGLHSQKHLLRQIIRRCTSAPKAKANLRFLSSLHATGVLLHGPAGTGKTLLRKAIEAEHDWADIVTWKNAGSKVAKLGASQLVHLEIPSKLNSLDATALTDLFTACPPSTLIVAEIRDPNDLQSFLRTGRAFSHEIEVSIPDAEQRLAILDLLNDGELLDPESLKDTASRTHGYVGDDLRSLLDKIQYIMDDNIAESQSGAVHLNGTHSHEPPPQNGNVPINAQTFATPAQLSLALTQIRPSALQSIFLEKPSVHWSDIGGQESFKARLQNAVEWPLKYPDRMRAFGIPPKKGILLYGPPGCSKTMLVKALATESSYNFLAVKGAELISMYVGESERATREVFRKARAASPCIIFFDEIDAIASRAKGDSGGGMLNVLTTLLNEMDGFEELKDVLVVAATNKPQQIDPALMRPGRFDNVVYIGPPDADTRRAIFEERFRKVSAFSQDAKDKLDDFVDRTEGLSGAEVVAVCQLAGEIAFTEEQKQESPGREILAEDVLEAVRKTPRSITVEMLNEYEKWNAERAAA